jgi:capsular polysaccharide biosynthesis protein
VEFWASVNVLRRRWYVLIPCLIFFGALGGLVLSSVKPTYQVTGKVLFVQPPQPKNTQEQNPLAGSSAEFATLVAPTLSNNAFKDSVLKAGGSADYNIAVPFASNPYIVVTVNGPTPEAATKSYNTFFRLMRETTDDFQSQNHVDTVTAFTPRNLGPPDGPTKIIGAKVKALIIVAGVGLIVSLGLTFLVDSMASARTRRKAARRAPTPIDVATSTSPFRLLDQLSDPDYGSRPVEPDVDDPHESDRATGN